MKNEDGVVVDDPLAPQKRGTWSTVHDTCNLRRFLLHLVGLAVTAIMYAYVTNVPHQSSPVLFCIHQALAALLAGGEGLTRVPAVCGEF